MPHDDDDGRPRERAADGDDVDCGAESDERVEPAGTRAAPGVGAGGNLGP